MTAQSTNCDFEGVERRQLTVLLCDLVGSTELSNEVDPEDLHDLIISFRQISNRAIQKLGGFVARYAGDNVLAYFGYPRADESEAENAVRAALKIVRDLENRPGRRLNVRIGIATGTVIAGDLVADDTAEYNGIIGKTPNLADRLMKLADPGEVVICDRTKQLVSYFFVFDDLGPKKLKGFGEPQNSWKVIGESSLSSKSQVVHVKQKLSNIVGRELEIEHLLRCCSEARSGPGRAVLICGEAGIGKSRLVRHTVDEILGNSSTNPIVKSVFCSHIHRNVPLYPIIKLIESDIEKYKKENSPSLEMQCKEILKYNDIRDSSEDLDSNSRKKVIYQKIEEYFEILNGEQFLVLIFEDMHWCDNLTFEILNRILASWINNRSAAIICTFRPDAALAWPDWHYVTRLNLNRLGPHESRELLEGMCDTGDINPNMFEVILRKSEGIPLLIEELSNHVVELGPKFYENVESRISDEFVPSTLSASLMARLDELGPAKRIAQAASVIGQSFSTRTVCTLMNMDNGALVKSLEKLVQSGIVIPVFDAAGVDYTFKHALVHDAAYLSVLQRERREFHKKIVGILKEERPEIETAEPALIADHYSKGGMSEEAIRCWMEAGEHAFKQSAYSDAVGHLSKALIELNELVLSGSITNLEVDLRMSLARALHALHGGAAEDVGLNYFRARDLLGKKGDVSRKFEVLVGCWTHSFISAKFSIATSLGEEIMEVAVKTEEPEFLAEANRINGMTRLYSGGISDAKTFLEEGIELFGIVQADRHRKAAGLDPIVCSESYMAYAQLLLGRRDSAIKTCASSLDFASAIDHPFTLAFSLAFSAFIYQHLEDLDKTIEYSFRSIEIAKEHNFRFWERQQSVIYNWAMSKTEISDASLSKLKESVDRYFDDGRRIESTRMLCLLAEIYELNDDVDFATKYVTMAKKAAVDSGEIFYLPEIFRLGGVCSLRKTRDIKLTKDQIHKSIKYATEHQLFFWKEKSEDTLMSIEDWTAT